MESKLNFKLNNTFKIGLLIFFIIFLAGMIFFGYFAIKNRSVVEINGHKFFTQVATTQVEQALGLGQRNGMRENEGMLFDFKEMRRHAFWMKDMKFNLDIIWIADQRIVYIAKNVSYNSPRIIKPEVDADKVLEIRGGISEKYDFKIGDEVVVH
jgi:hypothetical protein